MSIVLKLQIGKAERIMRGNAHFWSVACALQAEHREFTVSAIDLASNADSGDIRKFIRSLVDAGYAERIDDGEASPNGVSPAKRYRLVRVQSECPRLGRSGSQGTGQRNMWNVLRGPLGRGGINARDLAAYGSTDATPVSIDSAKAYLKMLAGGGYLSCVVEGSPGRLAIWRLRPSMNTGPLPPMILRSKVVYDQNAEKVMGDAFAEEERS